MINKGDIIDYLLWLTM